MTEAFIAIAVIAVLAAGYLLLRRPPSPKRQPHGTHKTVAQLTPQAQLYRLQMAQKFWGISIESHCRASSRLAGLKYPFENAPMLPVQDCPSTPCRCGYIGLLERRVNAERRSGLDRRRTLRMNANERRAERPRRNEDLNAWQSHGHL